MKGTKCDVFDYLDWRGDLTFQQSEFNEVDALILSILAYLDYAYIEECVDFGFDEVVSYVNQLSDEEKYNGPGIIMHSVVNLANQVANSVRFHGMGVMGYVNITDEVEEIQFAAITFLLPDQTAFLAFRGTDNTLVGWKEDFNMCFSEAIPSQIKASEYASEIARSMHRRFRLGGHSKGGNLSIWAGAYLSSEYKDRIINIYNNDGPGFSEEFLTSERYVSIRDRILSFVPESSIVGVLMDNDRFTTICSSNPSILQHDPFSWMVRGTHFIYDDTRTLSSRQFERIIDSWLRAMSTKEREELVDSIYDIVISSDAKTLEDLDRKKIKALFSMQKTFREMGLKKQTQLLLSISKLVFNSDILVNGNIFNLLSDDESKDVKL